jgi:predicted RNA-binding Zn ribbon-like protein
LRAALHRLFLAIATRRHPDPANLDHLWRTYADAMSSATLVAEGERFAWDRRPDEGCLDQLPWPVARSAVKLLTTGDPRRF